jgi:hypothetical protein
LAESFFSITADAPRCYFEPPKKAPRKQVLARREPAAARMVLVDSQCPKSETHFIAKVTKAAAKNAAHVCGLFGKLREKFPEAVRDVA